MIAMRRYCAITKLLFRLSLFDRSEEHNRLASFKLRLFIHIAVFSACGDETIQNLLTEALVSHLAASELQTDANLVAILQKADSTIDLGIKIVSIDTAGKLNFLDLNSRLLLFRFLVTLIALVAVFTVVHSAANRRSSLRRDEDEVHTVIESICTSLADGHDTQLIAILIQHTRFFDFDLIVDQQFLCYSQAPPVK